MMELELDIYVNNRAGFKEGAGGPGLTPNPSYFISRS